ncbi:MAG: hypothetical protein JNL08_10960 [Planctomycetes bacterium]|nr:hypothetical protein [Planctomycetota bacterium]
MTGESQRDDNDDFLDDDFVIEDIAPKNEDLETLFEVPEGTKAKPPAAGGLPDEEDVLFEAPKVERTSETFQGGPEFAEATAQGWDGSKLDLEAEAVGVPEPNAAVDDLTAAEATFTKELDSLLQAEEEFGLDSEQELEVIGASPAAGGGTDGISEFEQSGPFVLDDGDGAWHDEATKAGSDQTPAAADGDDADADVDTELPSVAASADEEQHEPGWEPLPAATVDDLSEVGEVARAEGDEVPAEGEYVEAAEPAGELVGAGVAAAAEGHDLYVGDEPTNEVLGAPARSGPAARLFWSMAATLMVCAAGAVMVLRPEWVGLRLEPQRVQQAEVARPEVAVSVPTPPPTAPAEVVPPPAQVPPTPTVVVTEPPPVTPPQPVEPPPVTPPVAEQPPPVTPVPVEPPVAVEPTPAEPAPVATEPPPAEPTPVVVAPTPELPGWPAPQATAETPTDPNVPGRAPSRLVRVSEELMIGEPENVAARTGASGVMPGSRAFAQLQNGNYFIGSVKSADSQRVTLRLDDGEVTLQVAAIARLTELGSQDYEELQRATSGFVRLTNNNRLVGGILSGIADDHIVLEFRKNRVMLPKSLIGEVVRGEEDAEIRLDTTREEDDWLRRLVERQLGTGVGAEPVTPSVPPQGTQPPR